MFIISVVKCFVITIIILFSCLPFASNSNAINAIRVDNSIDSLIAVSGASNGHSSDPNSNSNSGNVKHSSDSVDKGSCITKSDCMSEHSYCDQYLHRCKCNSDYVNVESFTNGSRTKTSIPTCLPVAKLDEKCSSNEQCLVLHSRCVYHDMGDPGYKNNYTSHYCKCREGYHLEDREEEILTKDNQRITNNPVCGEFVSMGNSWIGTFVIVCIMLLIILIGCFVGIIRFQRWKQRPMASTVTSLAEGGGGGGGHRPHLMSSSPPPMGSVEAEFQNDFIQVFPMHHLEPLPDKNTSHEYVIK